MRRKIVLLLGILLLLMVPTVGAFDGRDEETVTIGADEIVNDDLYIGSTTFVVDGTVNGDVFVGANEVVINGTVNGDLFAGAGTIRINGTVTDDVRVVGQLIKLGEGATVGGDFMAGGARVETADNSTIAEDALFGGTEILLNGSIGDKLLAGGGSLTLNGSIGGDAELGVGGSSTAFDPTQFMGQNDFSPLAPGLTINKGATIGGDLSYSGESEIDIAGDVAGEISFDRTVAETRESTKQTPLSRLWRGLQTGLVLFVLGLLWLRFRPSILTGAATTVRGDLANSTLWGAITAFGMPILLAIGSVALVAIASLFGLIKLGGVGASLAGIGMFAVTLLSFMLIFVAVYLAKIVTGLVIGRYLTNMLNLDAEWIALLIGILLVVLLSSLPAIGWLAGLLASLVGLGALWLSRRNEDIALVETAVESIIDDF